MSLCEFLSMFNCKDRNMCQSRSKNVRIFEKTSHVMIFAIRQTEKFTKTLFTALSAPRKFLSLMFLQIDYSNFRNM